MVDAKRDEPRPTRLSVHALANLSEPVPFVRESERSPVKPALRHIGDRGSRIDRTVQNAERSVDTEVQVPERHRGVMQRADVRGEGGSDPASRPVRKLAGPSNDQFVPAGGRARSRDFSPWTGMPWGWDGFGPDGFYSNRVVGYRSFAYPFGIGGPYFGNGYFFPGYYGYGYPPVAVGISGPTTIYYDDPLRRQWKLVDEGMKNLATGARRSNP